MIVAVSEPKAAAVVAFELPGPATGAEAAPGLEIVFEIEAGNEVGLGDEVESGHMKAAAVLVLQAEFAIVVGHTAGRLAVDIEHTGDNAAG